MKVFLERRQTSGPSSYETKIFLLNCKTVWAEHILQDGNLQVNLPDVENSIEIYYNDRSIDGYAEELCSTTRESYKDLPFVPKFTVYLLALFAFDFAQLHP